MREASRRRRRASSYCNDYERKRVRAESCWQCGLAIQALRTSVAENSFTSQRGRVIHHLTICSAFPVANSLPWPPLVVTNRPSVPSMAPHGHQAAPSMDAAFFLLLRTKVSISRGAEFFGSCTNCQQVTPRRHTGLAKIRHSSRRFHSENLECPLCFFWH